MMRTIGWIIVCTASLLPAQERAIDAEHSSITIHVRKAGLLSVVGHEHWIEAPIASGTVHESSPASVEFRVGPAKMRVRPDPAVDAKTQAEIQKDMEEKTLETDKYREIVFRSSRVEKQSEERFKVEGALTLHGVTKPVSFTVTRSGDAYSGRTTLKQSDFGIKPVTALGGTVKVQNELEIEFRVMAK